MQVHFDYEPPMPAVQIPPRHIYELRQTPANRFEGVGPSNATGEPNVPRGDAQHHGRRGSPPVRSKSAYFVYLLVGVHQTYAEAKQGYASLDFAKSLPVTYERNENGLGKCKTWLAVSRPFVRHAFAESARRQLALYAGQGAVRVGRGPIK
jgi:hypothetical protein